MGDPATQYTSERCKSLGLELPANEHWLVNGVDTQVITKLVDGGPYHETSDRTQTILGKEISGTSSPKKHLKLVQVGTSYARVVLDLKCQDVSRGHSSSSNMYHTAIGMFEWNANTPDIFMLGLKARYGGKAAPKTTTGWTGKNLVIWAKYPPTAVSWGQGRLDYFVVGSDGHALYHGHATTEGTWTRPEDGSLFGDLGGYITGRPAAVSSAQGRFVVFARGGGGDIWTIDFQPSGRGWTE